MAHQGALVAGVSLGFSFSAQAQNWDMPTPYPDGNYLTQNVIQFAEEVSELTDGRLTITVHSGASLFKMPEIKRAVRTRTGPDRRDPALGLWQ